MSLQRSYGVVFTHQRTTGALMGEQNSGRKVRAHPGLWIFIGLNATLLVSSLVLKR